MACVRVSYCITAGYQIFEIQPVVRRGRLILVIAISQPAHRLNCQRHNTLLAKSDIRYILLGNNKNVGFAQ